MKKGQIKFFTKIANTSGIYIHTCDFMVYKDYKFRPKKIFNSKYN